jgi:hypothetical protein
MVYLQVYLLLKKISRVNYKMSNYSLDNPIKRNVYVPDTETPFAPAIQPLNPSELDQSHRQFTWLHHRPQTVSSTHIQSESGRQKKK